MNLVSKILLQTAVALLLLNIVLYFVGAVVHSYSGGDTPRLIKPFEVSGDTDKGSTRGTTLAYLLSGQLAEIGKQMRASEQALKEAQQASKDPKVVMPVDQESLVKPIALPDTVFKPLELSMSVASVEVGKLLSWIHDWFVQDRALSLSVIYSGDKAVATGAMKGVSSEVIWVEGTAKDDLKLISQVAYAIAQKPFARAHPEVESLEPKEFGDLMDSLQRIAKLSRKAARGGVTVADYLAEFNRLEPMAETKLPKWTPLLHLAADLAERGEKTDKSLIYYKKELALMAGTPAAPGREVLEGKIRQLEEKLASAGGTAARTITAALTESIAGEKLLQLIGATKPMPADAPTPVVGIVGPMPRPELLPAGITARAISMAGEPPPASGDERVLENYIAGLVRETFRVNSKAEFVFAPVQATTSGGALGTFGILRALKGLADPAQKIQVLVVPYGPLDGKEIEATLTELAKQRIIAVLPAGNDPAVAPPFNLSALAKGLVIAAAVDLDGKPAAFSSRGNDVLWAPGHYIIVTTDHGAQERSGTSYATAVMAGAVGRLVSEFPTRSPAEIIGALRETSQAHGTEKVSVINLKLASDKLRSLPATASQP